MTVLMKEQDAGPVGFSHNRENGCCTWVTDDLELQGRAVGSGNGLDIQFDDPAVVHASHGQTVSGRRHEDSYDAAPNNR